MHLFSPILLISLLSFQFASSQSFRALIFADKNPGKEKDSINLLSGIYRLPGYTTVDKVSWHDSIYRFKAFEYGRITLATGFSPDEQLRFNYNLYSGQMQMITAKGDTAHVKRIKDLKFIAIADHLFLHDYKVGYIEVVHKGSVSLGVLNLMITADVDDRNSTSEYDRYYKKEKFYYVLDKNSKPYKAMSSTVQKLYHDQRKKIKTYLNENQVDFKNEGDLVKLLIFCDGLMAARD